MNRLSLSYGCKPDMWLAWYLTWSLQLHLCPKKYAILYYVSYRSWTCNVSPINQQLDVLLFISSSSKIHILQFMEQTICCVSFVFVVFFFLLFYPLFCTLLRRSVSIYSVALKFFQRMICKIDKISFFFYFHFITYLRYNFPAY